MASSYNVEPQGRYPTAEWNTNYSSPITKRRRLGLEGLIGRATSGASMNNGAEGIVGESLLLVRCCQEVQVWLRWQPSLPAPGNTCTLF